MILEAFSRTLRQRWEVGGIPARELLHHWLLEKLSEASPSDTISKILHMELEVLSRGGQFVFLARSPSGKTMLKALYRYCDSYEQWQFSRWLHHVKATAFNRSSG